MYFNLIFVFLLINGINCQQIEQLPQETEHNKYELNLRDLYKTSNEDLVNYLESLLESNKGKSYKSSQFFIPIKEKKKIYQSSNDYQKESSETEPLTSHRRKNYFEQNVEKNTDYSSKKTYQSCESKISIETNKIIDSKTSKEKGAIFLSVERVFSDSSSLTELQDACIKACCNYDFCDNALLSLKKSDVIYSFLNTLFCFLTFFFNFFY
jgi:hypothetical protein